MSQQKTIPLIFLVILTLGVTALYVWELEGIRQEVEHQVQEFEWLLVESTKIRVQEQVDVAVSTLRFFHRQFLHNTLDLRSAQTQAKDLIRSLRYGRDGYFWMDSRDYTLLVLPGAPQREGENRRDWIDARGFTYVKALVDGAVNQGGTFVSYQFPRLGGIEPQEKEGFARYFEPWEWVVGTGFYREDLESQVDAHRKSLEPYTAERILTLSLLALSGLVLLVLAYLWSVSRLMS